MKKLLSGITAMVLVLGLFTTGVQAEEATAKKDLTSDQVIQMIEQVNSEIYAEIDKADEEADKLVLSYEAAIITNEQLDKELDKIIDKLIKVTDKKTENMIKEASKSGYTIEPVWIEAEIGGRTVLVDPCVGIGV